MLTVGSWAWASTFPFPFPSSSFSPFYFYCYTALFDASCFFFPPFRLLLYASCLIGTLHPLPRLPLFRFSCISHPPFFFYNFLHCLQFFIPILSGVLCFLALHSVVSYFCFRFRFSILDALARGGVYRWRCEIGGWERGEGDENADADAHGCGCGRLKWKWGNGGRGLELEREREIASMCMCTYVSKSKCERVTTTHYQSIHKTYTLPCLSSPPHQT